MCLSIVPHDPAWKRKFADEADRISLALGQNVVAIHHIGSTAIPNIVSKPIIDITVEVSRVDGVDDRAKRMSDVGYEFLGEYGICGRRYFRRSGPDGHRAIHVHCFESGSEQVSRHIAFRDFLLAHPTRAQEYSDLKSRLIADGVTTSGQYQALKAPFIEAILRDVIEWSKGRL